MSGTRRIERRIPAHLEALIAKSGLPPELEEAVREVAHSRGRKQDVQSAVEEVLDHLHSGLESGRDVEELRRELGPVAPIRESLERGPGSVLPAERTSAPVLAVLADELRAALRSMTRSPGFLAGNVATMALGLGAAVTLFALVDGVILRPLPFHEPDRLFELRQVTEEGRRVFPSYPNFADLRERTDLFDAVLSTTWGAPVTVLGTERPVQAYALGISRDYFRALGVEPVHGRVLSTQENQVGGSSALMVSEEFWRDHLGAEEDLQRLSLQVNGETYSVVGVVPAGFRLLDSAELYIGHERFPGTARGAHAYQVVVRLEEGRTVTQAENALEAFYLGLAEQYPDQTESVGGVLLPLEEQIVGPFRSVVLGLFAASLLVVLLASCDVGASMLARSERRAGEIALSRSLGATRGRLAVRQISEGLLLVVPALLLGVGLALLTLRWMHSFGADEIPRIHEIGFDPRVALFGLVLALASLLAGSLVPLRRSLATPAASLLRESAAGGRSRRPGWTLLITAQIAVAFLMLAGAVLLTRSLDRVFSENVGFEGSGVIAAHFQLPSSRYGEPERLVQFHRRLQEELEARPEVSRASLTNYLPFDWGKWVAPVVTPDDERDWVAIAGFRLVEPNYFSVLGIPVLAGTTLPEDGQVGGTAAVVVNRSLAQRLAGDADLASVLGTTIRCTMDRRGEWATVVGVVEEARHWRAEPGQQPEIFLHWASRPEQLFSQVVLFETSGSPGAAQRAFTAALSDLDPDVPADLVALSERVRQTLSRERLATGVLGGFAAVMLILTLAGIVGVVSRATAERRREAGIRIALGATPRQIVALLQGEVLVPVILGLVVGVGGALYGTRALESLLYGVETTDTLTYVAASLGLLAVAFLASLAPARRILDADVARSVRGS